MTGDRRAAAAERSRRHRLRQGRAERVYRVTLPDVIVETLMRAAGLSDAEARSRKHVEHVIAQAVELLVNSRSR